MLSLEKFVTSRVGGKGFSIRFLEMHLTSVWELNMQSWQPTNNWNQEIKKIQDSSMPTLLTSRSNATDRLIGYSDKNQRTFDPKKWYFRLIIGLCCVFVTHKLNNPSMFPFRIIIRCLLRPWLMKTRFTRSCETFGTVGELCSPCFLIHWSPDELIRRFIPGRLSSIQEGSVTLTFTTNTPAN